MHDTHLSGASRRRNDRVGPLLRDWRTRRRVSQMNLALDVGVSARHLSFIETGRSRPSPALLLALADGLDVPLRERNHLLLAAGYAPQFSESALDSGAMKPVRLALQRLLDAHDPYPGMVLDRHWNVALANQAAAALTRLLPPDLCTPRLNLFRASLHPRGLAAMTANFEDWAGYTLDTLHRAVLGSTDAALRELEREVHEYPAVRAMLSERESAARGASAAATIAAEAAPKLLIPLILDTPQGRLSFFTTLTTFGTPRDITLDELCVELFYPADEATQAALRR